MIDRERLIGTETVDIFTARSSRAEAGAGEQKPSVMNSGSVIDNLKWRIIFQILGLFKAKDIYEAVGGCGEKKWNAFVIQLELRRS